MRSTVRVFTCTPLARSLPYRTTRSAQVSAAASRAFSTRDQRMHKDKRPPFYVPNAADVEALRGTRSASATDAAFEGQLAYRHYASQLNLCSYEDFQKGTRQAYDSLATVIERLTASESEPSKEMVQSYKKLLQSGMKHKEIAAVLQTWHAETTLEEGRKILAEAFKPESEWDLSSIAVSPSTSTSPAADGAPAPAPTHQASTQNTTSTSQAASLVESLLSTRSNEAKTEEVRKAFATVTKEAALFTAGLASILPISRDVAEDLMMLWAGYRLGLTNVLLLAAPNDLVEDVDVAGLVDLYNGKVYGEDTLRRQFKVELRLTDALRERVATHSNADCVEKISFSPKTKSRSTSAAKMAAADVSASGEAVSNDQCAAVRFVGTGLHDIPLDARFAVFVSLKVSVPRERYAKLFAPRTVGARLGNLLNRTGYFFLGAHPTFLDAPLSRSLFGVVPERLDGYTVGHGTVEKLMILYMTSSGRWVVSDLRPIRPVASKNGDAVNTIEPVNGAENRTNQIQMRMFFGMMFLTSLLVCAMCLGALYAVFSFCAFCYSRIFS